MSIAAESFHVVIPARLGSTRLPGKPLLDVAGKPLVVRVWERAAASGAAGVWVATDDPTIARAVEDVGGKAVLTSPDHISGTDRIAEVADRLDLGAADIVVNLQGDEPLVPPGLLRSLADALVDNEWASLSTLATPITSVADLFDPNVVKVTQTDEGCAHYFSRAPIPWVRGAFTGDARPDALPTDAPFLRHLGLYAYRVETLRQLRDAPPSALERAESLEQLRALALGLRIHVGVVAEPPGRGWIHGKTSRRFERRSVVTYRRRRTAWMLRC